MAVPPRTAAAAAASVDLDLDTLALDESYPQPVNPYQDGQPRIGETRGAGATTAMEASEGCLVWNEDATVGVYGLRDVAVIVANARVLVCPLDRAEEIKRLVGQAEQG